MYSYNYAPTGVTRGYVSHQQQYVYKPTITHSTPFPSPTPVSSSASPNSEEYLFNHNPTLISEVHMLTMETILKYPNNKNKIEEFLLRMDRSLIGTVIADGHSIVHLSLIFGNDDIALKAVNMGGDLTKKTPDKKSCLHLAAIKGYQEVALACLKAGVSKSDRDASGKFPFQYACRSGHFKLVELLDSKEESIDQIGEFNWTPFLMSCQEGDISTVKYCNSRNANAHHMTSDRNNGIHLAAVNGHVEVVRHLLSLGVKGDIPNGEGKTASQLAYEARHEEVWRTLNPGKEPNPPIKKALTKIEAAEEGDVERLQYFIDKGLNHNEEFPYKNLKFATLLVIATLAKQAGVVEYLLTLKKNKFFINNAYGIALTEDSIKVLEGLYQYAPGINDPFSTDNRTALEIALENPNEKVRKQNVIFLLGKNPNVNLPLSKSYLMIAYQKEDTQLMLALREKGARFKESEIKSMSPSVKQDLERRGIHLTSEEKDKCVIS